MSTITYSEHTEPQLGTTNRVIRGIIGAGALVAIFSSPGLTAGWLFALALVNCYASLTAILGIDFVEAMASVTRKQDEQRPAEVVELPRRGEEVEYRQAA
jgi:hypothetical protein